MKVLKAIFPFLEWLGTYTLKKAKGDVLAGLTVGVMLVPQAMAYALLAGLPPIYGLYASIVPLLIYPLLGSSRHLALGATAIDAIIVVVGVGALAGGDEARFIELALLLALMVGTIHLVLGLTRLGMLANLLSRPVIAGFTSAAVLIIAFSQLGGLLGISLPRTQLLHQLVLDAARQVGGTHAITAVLGGAGLLLLLGLKRWLPRWPEAFLVVLLGALAAWGLGLGAAGVDLVGQVPKGLPTFKVPVVDLPTVKALFPTAIALAFIQLANMFALGKMFAARHRYDIDPNQELIALGAANALGSLFQSFPVSGSYSRSAVGELSGGKTPFVNVYAALLVVGALLFLTDVLFFVPKTILAALVIIAVLGMLDLKVFRRLYRIKRTDGIIAVLTFVCTLVLGIQNGILAGILMSIVGMLFRISSAHIAVLGHLPHTRSFRDVDQRPEAEPIEGLLILRMDASFTYINAERLKDFVLSHTNDPEAGCKGVILDASTMNDLDTTAVEALQRMIETLAARGIELYLTGVHGKVQYVLNASGLRDQLGEDHVLLSPHRAVLHFLAQRGWQDRYSGAEAEAPDPAIEAD